MSHPPQPNWKHEAHWTDTPRMGPGPRIRGGPDFHQTTTSGMPLPH